MIAHIHLYVQIQERFHTYNQSRSEYEKLRAHSRMQLRLSESNQRIHAQESKESFQMSVELMVVTSSHLEGLETKSVSFYQLLLPLTRY